MVLTLHHLGLSQSERILLLLEELQVPYTMIKHDRAPSLAPESFKSLPGNRTGQAPFLEDPDEGITLSESGAICDYILAKHASTARVKMSRSIGEPGYTDYIYFYHFANATFQPATAQAMLADAFTAADCMMIYSLTTKRYFGPLMSYAAYPGILRYLKDVGERPAYRRMLEKGDPEMVPLLGAEGPEKTLLEVGGIESDIWKKK